MIVVEVHGLPPVPDTKGDEIKRIANALPAYALLAVGKLGKLSDGGITYKISAARFRSSWSMLNPLDMMAIFTNKV